MLTTIFDNSKVFKTLCLLAILAFPLTLHALPAHVHGKAQLQVAIEGNEIHLDFDSPLGNLLDFEHNPKNDQQRQAVKAMTEKLHHPETLFVMTKAAACVVKSVNLLLPPALLGSRNQTAAHADLEAEILFFCANSAALNTIEVQLFKAFPLLQHLQAEIVTEKGQSVIALRPESTVLTW
ncbi:MAG: DUF2796 domain-containing protein [Methylococcaceae bacterium]|nr:DUF2796 domain-containing protein [Methylococcaceae bacterium]